MLGGSMRLSASDAALIAMSAGAHHGARVSPQRTKPRPRTRDPILGAVPEPLDTAYRASTASLTSETLVRLGGREFPFPPRGSIASIGSEHLASTSTSSAKRPSRHLQKLEYELWCEAQRRAMAEAQLRTVTVHGRSRPPWLDELDEPPHGSSRNGLMPVYTK